jgi:hypothetical protein
MPGYIVGVKIRTFDPNACDKLLYHEAGVKRFYGKIRAHGAYTIVAGSEMLYYL